MIPEVKEVIAEAE